MRLFKGKMGSAHSSSRRRQTEGAEASQGDHGSEGEKRKGKEKQRERDPGGAPAAPPESSCSHSQRPRPAPLKLQLTNGVHVEVSLFFITLFIYTNYYDVIRDYMVECIVMWLFIGISA
jgi:hypothetical protein